MIIDQTPLADRFGKKYNHKWGDCIPQKPPLLLSLNTLTMG